MPINWTKVVRELDAAPCDIVQILDCCYSATAIKSKGIDAIHEETLEAEYCGKNEILASCWRDNPTAAGRNSAMPLFAKVLGTLASKNIPLSVYSWFHEVDSEVVMPKHSKFSEYTKASIVSELVLQPILEMSPERNIAQEYYAKAEICNEGSEIRSSSTSGYILAKIKIEHGRPIDIAYYVEEDM